MNSVVIIRVNFSRNEGSQIRNFNFIPYKNDTVKSMVEIYLVMKKTQCLLSEARWTYALYFLSTTSELIYFIVQLHWKLSCLRTQFPTFGPKYLLSFRPIFAGLCSQDNAQVQRTLNYVAYGKIATKSSKLGTFGKISYCSAENSVISLFVKFR